MGLVAFQSSQHEASMAMSDLLVEQASFEVVGVGSGIHLIAVDSISVDLIVRNFVEVTSGIEGLTSP